MDLLGEICSVGFDLFSRGSQTDCQTKLFGKVWGKVWEGAEAENLHPKLLPKHPVDNNFAGATKEAKTAHQAGLKSLAAKVFFGEFSGQIKFITGEIYFILEGHSIILGTKRP